MIKSTKILLLIILILTAGGFFLKKNLEFVSRDIEKNVFVVSVSGSVNNSTIIQSEKSFSLSAALDICGGLSENASSRMVDVYRINRDSTFNVIRLEIPKDSEFILTHNDMVVVRHSMYWSTQKEEIKRIESILAKDSDNS